MTHLLSMVHDLSGLRENFNPCARWLRAIMSARAVHCFGVRGGVQDTLAARRSTGSSGGSGMVHGGKSSGEASGRQDEGMWHGSPTPDRRGCARVPLQDQAAAAGPRTHVTRSTTLPRCPVPRHLKTSLLSKCVVFLLLIICYSFFLDPYSTIEKHTGQHLLGRMLLPRCHLASVSTAHACGTASLNATKRTPATATLHMHSSEYRGG